MLLLAPQVTLSGGLTPFLVTEWGSETGSPPSFELEVELGIPWVQAGFR